MPNSAFANNLIFLTARATNQFETLLKPGYLYAAALCFVTLTVIVVTATFCTLSIKKKKFKYRNSIKHTVEEWIAEALMNESGTDPIIPDNFYIILKKEEARQMLIEELVKNKSSFLGSVADNIIRVYYLFGLNVDSRHKLTSPRPHIQCQGIHKLCVMQQKKELPKVYRLANSKDKDVRIEAQLAILQWYGFKGLRFLDLVSYPITDFQQLKLLELLRTLPFTPIPKLANWLSSNNDTVVNFALKLAQHYKQVQVNPEAKKCLYHKNDRVRAQAVKTLAEIGDSSTADLLTQVYKTEKFTNRLHILQQLPKIAGNEQRDFLIAQLHEGHEYLKLASAKVLAECITEGMEILEAKSYDQPVPYHNIYLHVKAEAAR